ncbi:hypothetical protein TIFTF001_030427 [Ficus carica]|uniref:C2 domain-containing protein n=1 Tax=Ficus carica TaxID=3494 RepID=A0AA88IZM8_FICCA|nr:hypothetical protein TIFTF001_030427 [Ficus carica]
MTVLSGEDLRLASKSIKSNAFVFVRYGVNNFRTTETDGGEGGTCYPKWNEKLVLDLPPHVEAVTLEVHYKIAFGDEIVGTALVPVSDFAGGYMPESYLHFLSYRLRDTRGYRNGIINISVRMKVPAPKYSCSASVSSPEQMTVGVPVGKSNFRTVVTGVPVL